MQNIPNSPVLKRIETFTKKALWVKLAGNICDFFSYSVVILFTLIIFEYLFTFDSFYRTIFVSFLLIWFLAAFLGYFLHPLFKHLMSPTEHRILAGTEKIGAYFTDLKDKLTNAVQLIIFEEGNRYSASLIEGAFLKIEKETENLDFSKAIDKKPLIKRFIYFAIISFSFLILLTIWSDFRVSAIRLIYFSEEYIQLQEFYIIPENTSIRITKGDNVTIKAKVTGKSISDAELIYFDHGSDYQEVKTIKPDSIGNLSYTFQSPKKSFSCFFRKNKIVSPKINIEIINFPVIKNLLLNIYPPKYSGFDNYDLKDNGDFSVLAGTTVNIKILSSNPLKKAFIVFNNTDSIELNTKENLAFGTITCKNTTSYHFVIMDRNDISSINPVKYQISILPDAYPQIVVLKPEEDMALTEKMVIPTLIKVKDDFGISKINLCYKLSYSKYELPMQNYKSLTIKASSDKESLLDYLWDLTGMNLVTEDVVSYYFEVFDNDNISGPKSTKSEVRTLKVPSLDEILTKEKEIEKNTSSTFEQVMKESEELQKEIRELDKELKSGNEKLTWDDQKKAENLIKKQQSIADKIDNIKKNIEASKKQLSDNKLISNETLQKYNELQELLNELDNEQLKNSMQRMQDAMKNMNKQAMMDALKNFQFNEEMLKSSIERTLSLLKRVQIEQKIDELLKKIDKNLEKQNDLSEKLNNSNPSDKKNLDNLSNQQKNLSKELDNLKKDLAELESKMKEFPKEMPLKEMDDMLKEMEKEDMDKTSMEASEEMEKGDISKASKSQDKIKQGLNKSKKKLSNIKSMMMQNQMKFATNKMRSIVNNLLELSKKQESLKNRTKQIQPNSQQLNATRSEQLENKEDLEKILNQLSELGKQSFSVTPEMARSLGEAMRGMNNSLQQLSNNDIYGSAQHQSSTIGELNEAASQMNKMLQEMQQNGQGGGMMSFMQQLKNMSQQQMLLNQLTQQMLGNGQLSQEQMSQLQRLASQQQSLQKSLDQLNKEMKESSQAKKLLGNLDDAVKKMEEVVRDLTQNRLNDDVIKKQEKILTRLLDSQRSMNERDFEKQRESRSPKDDFKLRTPVVSEQNEEKNKKILIDLLKTLEEGYSKDYENLIRKYLEAIQKKINK